MESLAELRAREAEVVREWQWLHDAINSVARVRAENSDAAAFRLMQAQAMRVGQRRIELSLRIAEIEVRPEGGDMRSAARSVAVTDALMACVLSL